MNSIVLYHGSERIIENPCPNGGRPHNDYGQGFYCTQHVELAGEWAVDENRDGFINEYELDLTGLKILDLNSEDFSILHWLNILLEHRIVKLGSKASEAGRDFLHNHYHIDVSKYDVIIGYRADDSYFAFARAFASNQISLAQLEKAMYLGELGQQFFLQSDKAFGQLTFIGARPVESEEYYHKKMLRDQKAKGDYEDLIAELDVDGVYLVDMIRGEKKDGSSI